MLKGMVIHLSPVRADECGDEQEQGAFWLMEVGDEPGRKLEAVSGGDEDAGIAFQGVLLFGMEAFEQPIQYFERGGVAGIVFVGSPLVHIGDQWCVGVGGGVGGPKQAFQNAQTGRADGDDGSLVPQGVPQCFYGGARHTDMFLVHVVRSHGTCLYRFEGSGTHVEGSELHFDMLRFHALKYALGEVQSGGGGCDGTVLPGIDGLIALGILQGAVSFEIGWEGDNTCVMEYFGKDEGLVPGELEFKRVVVAPQADSAQHRISARRGNGFVQGAIFPFPVVANQGLPAHRPWGREIQDVILGQQGFQAKDLYWVAALGLKPYAGLYDAGVVEEEQSAGGKQVG